MTTRKRLGNVAALLCCLAILGASPLSAGSLSRLLADSGPVCIPESVRANMLRGGGIQMAVFAVVPNDSVEYLSVFGHKPSASEMADVRSAKASIPAAVHDTTFANGLGGLPQLKRMLEKSPADVIAITGHNSDGKFQFFDSEISLDDLAHMCSDFKKICVFLSCNSAKYVKGFVTVSSPITFDNAASIAKILKAKLHELKEGEKPDPDRVVFALQSAVSEVNRSSGTDYRVRPLTLIDAGGLSSTVIGALVYSCTQSETAETGTDNCN